MSDSPRKKSPWDVLNDSMERSDRKLKTSPLALAFVVPAMLALAFFVYLAFRSGDVGDHGAVAPVRGRGGQTFDTSSQPANVTATKFVADGLSRKVLNDVTEYGAPNCEDLKTLIEDVRAIGGDTHIWEQLRDSTPCTHEHPWAGDSGN